MMYLLMIYVTLEQERALKYHFHERGWNFCKPDLTVLTDIVGPQSLNLSTEEAFNVTHEKADHVTNDVASEENLKLDLANEDEMSLKEAPLAETDVQLAGTSKSDSSFSAIKSVLSNKSEITGEDTYCDKIEARYSIAVGGRISRNDSAGVKEQSDNIVTQDTDSKGNKNNTENREEINEREELQENEHHENGEDTTCVVDNTKSENDINETLDLDSYNEVATATKRVPSNRHQRKKSNKEACIDVEEKRRKLDGSEEQTLKDILQSCENSSLGKNVYCCSKCGITIKRKSNLKRHVRSHLPDQIRCSICNQFFSTESEKAEHMETKHSSPNICHICGATFYRKFDMNIHLAKHGCSSKSTSNFKCPVENCNKEFYRKIHFTHHKNTHTGEKPYTCAHCEKKFHSAYSQKTHEKHCRQNFQNRLQEISCSKCNETFTSKNDLAHHESLAHTNNTKIIPTTDSRNIANNSESLVTKSRDKTLLNQRQIATIAHRKESRVVDDRNVENTMAHEVDDHIDSSDQATELQFNESIKFGKADLRILAGVNLGSVVVQHLPSGNDQNIFSCLGNETEASQDKSDSLCDVSAGKSCANVDHLVETNSGHDINEDEENDGFSTLTALVMHSQTGELNLSGSVPNQCSVMPDSDQILAKSDDEYLTVYGNIS